MRLAQFWSLKQKCPDGKKSNLQRFRQMCVLFPLSNLQTIRVMAETPEKDVNNQ